MCSAHSYVVGWFHTIVGTSGGRPAGFRPVLISQPNAEKVNAEAVEWLGALLSAGISVLIPEIADYEVRRELLRAGRTRGVRRLDEL